ncbi:MAG: NAD-dependent epimerase/dehydratase family protein [Candidatus Heimdallarchaeaceae archaeon]
MSKRALVTGGCGFIGSHLVDTLISNGYFVTVVDNLTANTNLKYLQRHIDEGMAEFYKYDLTNFELLNSIKSNFECLFHLAAQPDVKISVSNPRIDFENNVVGTFNVLEYCRLNDVQKMIFASSVGTVYGEPEVYPTPETYPLRPISNYGAAKAAAEMYCSSYSSLYGIDITALRLGNIFGPRSTHGVMFDFYNKLRSNPSKLEILGDGNQTKTYLYILDTIDAFLTVFNKMGKGFESFNVSSEELISVKEIADTMVKEMDLKDVVYSFTGGKRGWKGDVIYTSVDITKLTNLGWRPKTSIRDGIRQYVKWLNDARNSKF